MNNVEDVDDFLMHFGVKGMKWGVRKDKGHEGQRARAGKIARLDKKYEKNVKTARTFIDLYNAGADYMNKEGIPKINSKPEYKNSDLEDGTPLRKKYDEEYGRMFVSAMDRAAKAKGSNASGTKQMRVRINDNGGFDIINKDIRHADDVLFTFYPKRNARGLIVSMEMQDPSEFEHVDVDVDDFLMHHGVKGMKWGVRKAKDSGSSSGERSRFDKSYGDKDYSSKEIREARKRLKPKYQKAAEYSWDNEVSKPKTAAERAKNAKAKKMFDDILKDPDSAIATRVTAGENLAAGIIAGPLGSMALKKVSSNRVKKYEAMRKRSN